MANVTIELGCGAKLTVKYNGNTVEITADTDAEYEVVPNRPNRRLAGTTLELRFARGKAHRRHGYFALAKD